MIWCASPALAPLVAAILTVPNGWGEAVPLDYTEDCSEAQIVMVEQPEDIFGAYRVKYHDDRVGQATIPLHPEGVCLIEITESVVEPPPRQPGEPYNAIWVYVINHELGHCLLRREDHPAGTVLGGFWWPTRADLDNARAIW